MYIGSFWNKPLKNPDLLTLFESEMEDLIADVKSVPRNGVLRKLNELVKSVIFFVFFLFSYVTVVVVCSSSWLVVLTNEGLCE